MQQLNDQTKKGTRRRFNAVIEQSLKRQVQNTYFFRFHSPSLVSVIAIAQQSGQMERQRERKKKVQVQKSISKLESRNSNALKSRATAVGSGDDKTKRTYLE